VHRAVHGRVGIEAPFEVVYGFKAGAIQNLGHQGASVAVVADDDCLPAMAPRRVAGPSGSLVEDERGLLQATIFRDTYERYGDVLHHRGAFLLEGRVEYAPAKGSLFW
jgi:hypothetical protein